MARETVEFKIIWTCESDAYIAFPVRPLYLELRAFRLKLIRSNCGYELSQATTALQRVLRLVDNVEITVYPNAHLMIKTKDETLAKGIAGELFEIIRNIEG